MTVQHGELGLDLMQHGRRQLRKIPSIGQDHLRTGVRDHPGEVALETSREVAVVDAHNAIELFRFDTGRAPQGLVLSPDSRRLYVNNFMDRSVSVFDLTRLGNSAQWDVPLIGVLSSVAAEKPATVVSVCTQLRAQPSWLSIMPCESLLPVPGAMNPCASNACQSTRAFISSLMSPPLSTSIAFQSALR